MVTPFLIGLGALLLGVLLSDEDEGSDDTAHARITPAAPPRPRVIVTNEPPELPLFPPELPAIVDRLPAPRPRVDLPEPPLIPSDLPPLKGKVIQLPTQHITASPPSAAQRAADAKAAAALAQKAKAAAAKAKAAPAPAARPVVKVPAVAQPKPIPKPAPPPPARAVAPAKPAAAAAKPTAAPTAAQNAARGLDAYIKSGGRDRAKIASMQWQLGLDTDGIPGPNTRAAVQKQGVTPTWAALTSKQVTGAVPGGATKLEAAQRLERYWGLRGRDKERIKAYQRMLAVTADGIMGPKTRAAADSALGRKAALAA